MSDPVALATEAQRAAADPKRDAFVVANAGTGKTKVLVDRVTRLLMTSAAPDRILCLTYTKAAASEMQERLFDRLGQWSVLEDDPLRAEVEKATGAPPPQDDLPKARRLFARALETPGGLKVQTIHAFCERLIRQFPQESDVTPGFRVLEEAEAANLIAASRAEIARAALDAPDSPPAKAFELLAERVDDMTGDRLVSALTGERLMLGRALDRLGGFDGVQAAIYARLSVDPADTEQSVKEAAWNALPRAALERARDALNAGTKTDVKAGAALDLALAAETGALAFDFLAQACLTQAGDVPKNGTGTKGARAACSTLTDLFGDREAPGSATDAVLYTLDTLRRLNCAEMSRAVFALAEGLNASYERRKKARRALDYDDLIALARRLLQLSDARDWVRYKLDGGIDHILVDEAQDTAPDQWDLVAALTEEFFAGTGTEHDPRTLFAVGDEKQSIYSFQGADPARFLEETRRYHGLAEAGGRSPVMRPLQVSFRSAPSVLETVDAVFADEVAGQLLPNGPPGGDITAHRSARFDRETHPGAVELWAPVPVPEAPEAENPWTPVDAPSPGNAQEQLARRIAATVKGWIEGGLEVAEGKGHRPAHAGDVMILLRRRSGFFYEIIRQLKSHGVPVAGADRLVLTDQQVARDLLSLARFALLPEDDLSLAETLKSPLFHPCDKPEPPIDDAALFDLCHPRDRYQTVWEALRGTNDPRFTEAKDALADTLAQVGRLSPYAFFAHLLNHVGPEGESYRRRLLRRLGPEAEDPLEEFLNRALAHQGKDAPSLQRFVQEMERDSSEVKREMEGAGRSVRVMTVHGSKGLEAPLVILPDTTQTPKARTLGLFEDAACGAIWSPYKGEDAPLAADLRAAEEEKDYGEYLRLLYVAMTRARDRLIVCGYRHGRRGKPGLPTEEGRLDEGCWHQLVQAGLNRLGAEDAEREGLEISRHGADETWLGRGDERDGGGTPLPGWIRQPAAEEQAALRSVAPSHIDEDMDAAAPGFSPLEDESGRRWRRGSLIHKLLELLPEAAPGRRAAAAAQYLSRQPELDDAEREDITRAVFKVLDDPAFAPLFAPGSRAEVSVVGAAPELGPRSVNGEIDRLVVTETDVLIVDYKTNRPPPEDVADVDPAYATQLAAYRAVLRQVFPDRVIRCALLWTESGKLMEIPSDRLDAAIAGLTVS